ncbi:MAG: hypothetical protein LBP87_03985, partial [Planctomycetaceae bacterium]|nr:hypothetical protein [Planctomycetaceae bacterium]
MKNTHVVLSVGVFFSAMIILMLNPSVFAAESYKGPIDLKATKDGSKIYVTNYDAHEIAVLNTA